MTYPAPGPQGQPAGHYPPAPYARPPGQYPPQYPPQAPQGQPGGYYPPQGPYGQPGGYGPPPPQKNNTGLIVGIIVAVVLVLGTLGITGFVAPGFLLADDESSDAAGGADSGDGGGDNGPAAAANAMMAVLNNNDVGALEAVKCGNADRDLDQLASELPQITDAKVVEPPQPLNDTQASVKFSFTYGGSTQLEQLGALALEGDKWCWEEFDRPASRQGT